MQQFKGAIGLRYCKTILNALKCNEKTCIDHSHIDMYIRMNSHTNEPHSLASKLTGHLVVSVNLQWQDQKCSQTPQRWASALLKLKQVYASWCHQSLGHRDACWSGRHIVLAFRQFLQPEKPRNDPIHHQSQQLSFSSNTFQQITRLKYLEP